MIKPKPWVYVCPACGWRKAVFPESDALLPEEHCDCCPACGNKPLQQEALNPFSGYGVKLLGKLFKR